MFLKLIYTSIIFICLYQLYYLISAFILAIFHTKRQDMASLNKKPNRTTIIIPVYNSQKTIGLCLESILNNNTSFIKEVFVILDHCTDNSPIIVRSYEKKFAAQGLIFKTLYPNQSKIGKVAALLEGIRYCSTSDAILLDADNILAKNAIERLIVFHRKNNHLYSSCLIYPYQQDERKTSLIEQIINNDRLYRQNILQGVRDIFGLANFPGGVGMVNIQSYKRSLSNGFLEDLSATYNILAARKQIRIIPEPLSSEVERETFKGVILQRVRWTVGNLENISLLIKAVNNEPHILKKLIIISYPIMWYLQHYVIVIGLILSLFTGEYFPFLIPMILYLIQLTISYFIGRREYKNNFLGVILHTIIYPFIITGSLIGALGMLATYRRFYFRKRFLFNRI